MNYWLIVTSRENFRHDREILKFKYQGLPNRFRKQVQRMEVGDRIAYYIMKLQKFGATATITGDYFNDTSKLWTDDNEMWPARRHSKPDIVLEDDELIDAKKLVPDLSFIEKKDMWGVYFQGSIKSIPEEDFRLIESEMRKVVAERPKSSAGVVPISADGPKTEQEYEDAIMKLPLQANSLHDRIGEMLEQIGSWMDFNTQTRHRITPDHAYVLDVAWLSGKNPEVALEIQLPQGDCCLESAGFAEAKFHNAARTRTKKLDGSLVHRVSL